MAVAPARVQPLWRQPPVWFLVLARLCATLGTHLTGVHLVAFFVAAGYDPLLAAAAIAGVGCVSVVGRPLSGALSDAFGREVIYTVGLGVWSSAPRRGTCFPPPVLGKSWGWYRWVAAWG